MKLNKVLVPIDYPGFGLGVLPHLTHLLDPQKTELLLLHVMPVPESIMVNEEIVVYSDQEAASMEEDGKLMLHPYAESLEQLGYHVTPVVSFGDPARGIEYIAEKENVDLVAMATHGRTGFARLLRGSVAQHVFEHVEVPVLLDRGVEEE